MSVSLTWQVTVLGQCLAMGVGVGLLYDLLRQVRLLLPWRWLQEGVDLLFWMGACGTLFFCAIVLGTGGCGCTSPFPWSWGRWSTSGCSASGSAGGCGRSSGGWGA